MQSFILFYSGILRERRSESIPVAAILFPPRSRKFVRFHRPAIPRHPDLLYPPRRPFIHQSPSPPLQPGTFSSMNTLTAWDRSAAHLLMVICASLLHLALASSFGLRRDREPNPRFSLSSLTPFTESYLYNKVEKSGSEIEFSRFIRIQWRSSGLISRSP